MAQSGNTCPEENSKPGNLVRGSRKERGKMIVARRIYRCPSRLFESVTEKLFFEKKKKNEKKKESWNLFLGQIRTTFARCRTVCRSNAFLFGIQDNLSGLFQ